MVTADILNTHSLKTLRSEISKTNIKGYSKMKKAEVVELMLKNKDRFMHIQKKQKKTEPEKEQKTEPEKKPKLKLKQKKTEPEKKPKLKLKQKKTEPEKKQKLKLNGELVMIGKRGFVVKGKEVFHKKSGKAVSEEVKKNVLKYFYDPVFQKKIDAKNPKKISKKKIKYTLMEKQAALKRWSGLFGKSAVIKGDAIVDSKRGIVLENLFK